jgi:hypothetical protein
MNETRYRLIYTLGTNNPCWHVFGKEAAYASATKAFEETDIPIAVFEASEDGMIVRRDGDVGIQELKDREKARRAAVTAANGR